MRLLCEFSTSVARTDLDDYLRHLEISVGCYDENALSEYIVGKLAVDQIMWADAITDGVFLFEICDNDSQGLHDDMAFLPLLIVPTSPVELPQKVEVTRRSSGSSTAWNGSHSTGFMQRFGTFGSSKTEWQWPDDRRNAIFKLLADNQQRFRGISP